MRVTSALIWWPGGKRTFSQGYPDFHVYAGSQLVGRIYQTLFTGTSQGWSWGVNALTVDLSVGAVMHGYAADLLDAKTKLRAAFDRWIEWAEAMPKDDLKYRSGRGSTQSNGVG